jgi:hypothetical protein
MSGKVWDKSKGFGSGERYQRNYYAFLVMCVMSGGEAKCPLCSAPYVPGMFDVDRTIGGQGTIYREGECVMICSRHNAHRATLQSVGRDWTHADQYAADVASASAHVSVPTVKEARFWWQGVKDAEDIDVHMYA